MSEFFATRRRVEFCETDAAGIAHFSAFLIYMEQAEHEFWRSLGRSVVQALDVPQSATAHSDTAQAHDEHLHWHLSWPRVHVECDYQGAARFEDVLQVELRIARLGRKSVTYEVQFQRGDDAIASGKVVAVCCRVRVGRPLESIDIPTEIADALAPFVTESRR